MTCMADQNDLTACCVMVLDLSMHLGDQRTSRVYVRQPSLLRFRPDGLGDSVSREHEGCTVRDLFEFLDKDGTLGSEIGHHRGVVHDLVPHENRRAKSDQTLFNGLDRAFHASAKA